MRFFVFLSIFVLAVVSTILSDTMTRDLPVVPGAHNQIAQPENPGKSILLKDRDADTTTYMAWATDPKNDAEIQETWKFLNNTVVTNQFITHYKARDGTSFVWGGLTFDASALQKVEAYSKLKDVMVETEVEYDLAISREEEGDISA